VQCYLGSSDATTCHPTTFTFESGTTEGLAVDALNSAPGATIATSSARAHGGTSSLAVPIESPTATKWIVFRTTWCSQTGEGARLAGATLAMWIYLDDGLSRMDPGASQAQMMLFNAGGNIATLPIYSLPVGVWHQVTYKVPVVGQGKYEPASEARGLTINMAFPGGWGGTVYVDDITVTPAPPM
jgi:hypothetical protein